MSTPVAQSLGVAQHVPLSPTFEQLTIGGSKCEQLTPGVPQSMSVMQLFALAPHSPGCSALTP